jgi:predicted nucleic acid-binding protein
VRLFLIAHLTQVAHKDRAANQISTDDFAGPLANQTNLAIKGIVGIGAMSKIMGILGNTAQATNYSVRRQSAPVFLLPTLC